MPTLRGVPRQRQQGLGPRTVCNLEGSDVLINGCRVQGSLVSADTGVSTKGEMDENRENAEAGG